MEFIQKKTIDGAVESFLPKAADSEIALTWDRYEGQLPECGFCETGLSCRDCLQGPCISHPFRETNKVGVCGKDQGLLASHSLLRLVLKGTLTFLDQLSDFAKGVEGKKIRPKNKTKSDQLLKELQSLFKNGGTAIKRDFPRSMVQRWEDLGIKPEGLPTDLFKASQNLEGGVADAEENLLWAFKSSLLACLAQRLQGELKRAVFGDRIPTTLEVNLGVLRRDAPNLVLHGRFSPILKSKIAEAAEKKKINVIGLCTDPLLPSCLLPIVTNYGSQEIPLMTGAVDLMVVGNQFVNPSLALIATHWKTPMVTMEGLRGEKDPDRLAKELVEQAKKSFDFRQTIPRDIPQEKESAVMGFSVEMINVKKVIEGIQKGMIKGIATLAGSNNVKFTQDQEILTIAREFLKNDILCLSEGEVSVSLAKHGFLKPGESGIEMGKGLADLLPSLGKNLPPILDFGSCENGGLTEFLLGLSKTAKKEPKDFPILACFAEANRSAEVTEALWTTAMGVSTYFWPALPIVGSQMTMMALSQFCKEKLGALLYVPTDKKMEARSKAALMMKNLTGEGSPRLSGYPWTGKQR